jgi:NADH-quinone oxidoreductase subunit A
MPTAQTAPLWPLGVYIAAAVIVVTAMIAVSYVLGQRHMGRETGEPYESGVAATGTAHVRFDVKFYLIAMFFVIFDLEAVFIFAWAVALREAGWTGYIEILVFIGILGVVLLYLWRTGALEWGSRRKMTGAARGKY